MGNLLFFEKYTLTTNLSLEKVLERIAMNVEPKQGFKFRLVSYNYTRFFIGDVSGTTFRIIRNINYRNSFLPLITGHIETTSGKTEVRIKMQPVIFVLVFITFWLGVVGLICIGELLLWILHFKQTLQNGFSPLFLIPFGMFAFGYALVYLSFNVECKRAKEYLARILESN